MSIHVQCAAARTGSAGDNALRVPATATLDQRVQIMNAAVRMARDAGTTVEVHFD